MMTISNRKLSNLFDVTADESDGEEEEKNKEDVDKVLEFVKQQQAVLDKVRFQPISIAKKLRLQRKARRYVKNHQVNINKNLSVLERIKQTYATLIKFSESVASLLLPWEQRIKQIEGYQGSVVASYFIFLRWMVWVNLWLTLFQASFIILPEALFSTLSTKSSYPVPLDEIDTQSDLKTLWDATGIVEYSFIFYGYYGVDKSRHQLYPMPLAYLMTGLTTFAFSFIVVLRKMAANARMNQLASKEDHFTFSWQLFCSWDFTVANRDTASNKHNAVSTAVKESIREVKEKTKDQKRYVLVALRILGNVLVLILLALSAWVIQLCVQRSRELEQKKSAADDFQASFWQDNELTLVMTIIATVYPNFFDLIAIMEKYHPRTNLRMQLARIFALNLLNLYTLFIALFWKQQDLAKRVMEIQQNATVISCEDSALSTISPVTIANVTAASTTISSLVNGTAATASLLTSAASSVGSSMIFNYSTVPTTTSNSSTFPPTSAIPVTSHHTQSSTVSAQLRTTDTMTTVGPECFSMGGNNTDGGNNTLREADIVLCWETSIGQEIFKLTIMDLVFIIGQILIQDFLRGLVVRYCNPLCFWDLEKTFPEYPDFKTADNILHLVNNQGMIWIGTLFAPGLAILNMFKLLLLLYVRCWTATTCNVPQEQIFRASRSNNFYYALLLVMLFLCTLPPLFAIVAITPSPDCGPFSGKDKMYDVLIEFLEDKLPSVASSLLSYIASPGIIIPAICLLAMTIYYLTVVSQSLKAANQQLQKELEYERTEGKRRVYAMADAKRTQETGERKGAGITRAVSSVMAATKLARLITSSKGKPSVAPGDSNSVSKTDETNMPDNSTPGPPKWPLSPKIVLRKNATLVPGSRRPTSTDKQHLLSVPQIPPKPKAIGSAPRVETNTGLTKLANTRNVPTNNNAMFSTNTSNALHQNISPNTDHNNHANATALGGNVPQPLGLAPSQLQLLLLQMQQLQNMSQIQQPLQPYNSMAQQPLLQQLQMAALQSPTSLTQLKHSATPQMAVLQSPTSLTQLQPSATPQMAALQSPSSLSEQQFSVTPQQRSIQAHLHQHPPQQSQRQMAPLQALHSSLQQHMNVHQPHPLSDLMPPMHDQMAQRLLHSGAAQLGPGTDGRSEMDGAQLAHAPNINHQQPAVPVAVVHGNRSIGRSADDKVNITTDLINSISQATIEQPEPGDMARTLTSGDNPGARTLINQRWRNSERPT